MLRCSVPVPVRKIQCLFSASVQLSCVNTGYHLANVLHTFGGTLTVALCQLFENHACSNLVVTEIFRETCGDVYGWSV